MRAPPADVFRAPWTYREGLGDDFVALASQIANFTGSVVLKY